MPIDWLILLGFTYYDGREKESDRNIIFRCSFIGYFFPEFHIVATGNVFLCLTMIQKRKNIKTLGNRINTPGSTPPRTNRIASCFDALSITYIVMFHNSVCVFTLLHTTGVLFCFFITQVCMFYKIIRENRFFMYVVLFLSSIFPIVQQGNMH
jgi:hypothetical protein